MTLSTDLSARSVATGPAGRAMAQPMDSTLLEGLLEHLSMERRASTAYFALALWFAERELRGFAAYLHAEAATEQAHAAQLAEYLIARGQTVLLQEIPAPRQIWTCPEEAFTAIFEMESDVTTSLQQLYAMAERAGDVRTTVVLDPMVQQQINAEDEAAHLLGRVRFARNEPAPLLILDAQLAEDATKATAA